VTLTNIKSQAQMDNKPASIGKNKLYRLVFLLAPSAVTINVKLALLLSLSAPAAINAYSEQE